MVVAYASLVRTRGFLSLVGVSTLDLFDQATAFGRLALVHVIMMTGDTLVTISLAGSLFFSVSPTEAKGHVLLYLLLTIAPFAVVSPLLGPLIDRSANGRRSLVAVSALVRCLLCYQLSHDLTNWLLFPEAFVMLVSSKLYVVTRGTLVPEMARTDQFHAHGASTDDAGWPSSGEAVETGFSGFNAQLTLLGTCAGLIGGSLGVGILKSLGASSVLWVASVLFAGGVVASFRLVQPVRQSRGRSSDVSALERDIHALSPTGDAEVSWGLSAAAVVRFVVGFATFLLAFGLRRAHAPLTWFALALSLAGVGSLLGLALVTRVRNRLHESTLMSLGLFGIAVGTFAASRDPRVLTQVVLVGWIGAMAAIVSPSFDAITQRHVPEGARGQTFARFAVRQQLSWVIGAIIPVAISLNFGDGDAFLSVMAFVMATSYVIGRRWSL